MRPSENAGTFFASILCRIRCWITLWIACQVAVVSGMCGMAQQPNSSARISKPSAPARDDLPRLRRLENQIGAGEFQAVEPPLRAYLRAHPNSARAYYDLGYILFRTHQITASIEALAKSLQLDIRNPEAHKILGLDFTIIGKYDEAQIEMEQAARLKPDSAEIHYFLGRIHYTRNAFPLAKQEYEKAIHLDATYMKAYNNLGLTLEAMGDDEAALVNYEKAFELIRQQGLKSEWPYVNVCAMYNRQNKPDQALEFCRKAIELNPKAEQAFFEIARAYMAQKDWEQAAAALRNAIEINPRFAKFHYGLSTVYRKLGMSEESEREMAVFRKLSDLTGEQQVPETASRPAQEPDVPVEVKP